MNYEPFDRLLRASERPVVLIEGTRKLPEKDAGVLTAFARWLAETYPHAIFRTGNAEGSDSAFADGVAQVDPTRIEYVLPYGGHRKGAIARTAFAMPLSELPHGTEERAAYHTRQATPEYGAILAKRDVIPRLRAKAQYILRDTIKVVGAAETPLAPATAGIFYVDLVDPMKGGTGHTIRVCRKQGVPVAFQDEWMKWPTGP